MQLLLSKFNLKYFIHMLILVREKNFCLFWWKPSKSKEFWRQKENIIAVLKVWTAM
jgi:hypothetical protein